MKRRGFVFTLDALISLLLVMVFVSALVTVNNNINVYSTYMREHSKYDAQDILNMWRSVSLRNLVPPEKIEEWKSDGTLDEVFVTPDMPPLEVVATYWAINSTFQVSPSYQERAEKILNYLLTEIVNRQLGYKYQLIINNYTSPFLTFDYSYENASDVSTATAMVSGFKFNQTPRGYVAKAYLTKGTFVRQELIGIQRVLAGGTKQSNAYSLSLSQFNFYYQAYYSSGWDFNENDIQSGQFIVQGSYDSSSVNINDDLGNNWVDYDFYSGYYVYMLQIYSGNTEVIRAYTTYISYNLKGNTLTETYRISRLYYYYPNGDYIKIDFTDGVFLEVTWQGTRYRSYYIKDHISSSRVYENNPTISSITYYTSQYNSLIINSTVLLPDDANVLDALWHAAQRGQYETMQVSINGNTLADPYNENVTTFFHNGTNTVEAVFASYGDDEIGLGSGSWLYLKYNSSDPSVEDPGLVKLYDVTSAGTGIYYLNSLFVPGNIKAINATLTVEGVHEVRIYYSNGTALNLVYENTTLDGGITTLVISNETLLGGILNYTTLENLNKKNFNLVIMLDAYYDPAYDRTVRYAGQDYHTDWSNTRRLYGYPNSSIKITYESDIKINKFYIPQEEFKNLDPSQTYSTYMTFNYYLPDKAVPWYIDIWSAINFYLNYLGVPGTITLYENSQQFIQTPLDYYLIRVSYRKLQDFMMVPGQINTFTISASSQDDYYRFRPLDSRAIVHYFLYGYAPYGDIFDEYSQNGTCGYNLHYYYNLSGTLGDGYVEVGYCRDPTKYLNLETSQLEPTKYALDDAIVRLFENLGAESYEKSGIIPGTQNNRILVKLDNLRIDTIGLRNVPKTLHPIEVTLRLWREGQ
jgi:hypothetical protein